MASALADAIAVAKRDVSPAARIRGAVQDIRKALPTASFDLPSDMGKIELELRSGEERPPLRRALEDLNQAVRRRDSYLVLAIDEIQEANIDDLREVVMFVHATAGTMQPAVFLGAGLTNSAQHLHDARTYTERWRYPRLDRVGTDETKSAIAIPAAAQGVAFTAEALDLLAEETAGYPFFIQEYASVMWTFTDGPIIDHADVAGRIAGVRSELDEQFYAPRFARLTARECAYALALADLGEGPHPVIAVANLFASNSRDVSSIRNRLIKKELIFASAPGVVEFRMPLTDRYVTRNRESLERRAAASELWRARRSV
jgi:hypothetical protein